MEVIMRSLERMEVDKWRVYDGKKIKGQVKRILKCNRIGSNMIARHRLEEWREGEL